MTNDLELFIANYPCVTKIKVQWGDMDALQHVNNVVYFRYFEIARIEYYLKMFNHKKIVEDNLALTVASQECRYRSSLTFPDELYIATFVTDKGPYDIMQEYKIFSTAQDKITTEGKARLVLVNTKTGKKELLAEEIQAQIKLLQPS